MKRLFYFKYPKIATLILVIFFSYILFSDKLIHSIIINLEGSLGYLGIFIAGILFAFGFTSPISVGYFISLNPNNILFAALLGSIGSVIANYLIFKTIKTSFLDEFKQFEKTNLFKEIHKESKLIPRKIKSYLIYIFVGIVIASPLPDEFGVTMLASLKHIKTPIFIIISFILHFIGIFVLLLL